MSDGFRNLFSALRREVQERSPRRFLEAQARHPCLAPYPDLASALASLGQVDVVHWSNREKVIRAIIAEYQETSLPLWAAALLVIFSPMLHRLRSRVRRDAFESDDLDQFVIASFLSTIATFSPVKHPNLVALRLRQDTQHLVFNAVRREQAARSLENRIRELVEATDWGEVLEELEFSEKEDPRTTLVRVFDSYWPQIPLKSRLVVFTTVINNASLRQYVDRTTDVGEGRERVYRRLQQRRTRVFKKLREWVDKRSDGSSGTMISRAKKADNGVER